MSIPIDILENVIDVLSQDDPNFLSTKTCSLVCHDFRDISRKHIFASLELNGPDHLPRRRSTTATTAMLTQLLSTAPGVAHYVRNLSYVITQADLCNPSLMQTFNQITNLRYLAITVLQSDGEDNLKWNNNPLRPALLHLLHIPTLLHFKISAVDDFVLTDMIPCINLKHFEFNRLGIVDTKDNIPFKSS